MPISGSGELSQLAVALNEMRDSLADKIITITAQREDLEAVLANLRDAIVALDSGGRIVLANRAAMQLLAAESAEMEGRPLQMVIRTAGIVDAYNHSVASGQTVARHVEADFKDRPRHLDVLVSPVASHAGKGIAGLIVIRDITDLVQRRDEGRVRRQRLARIADAAGDDPRGRRFAGVRRSVGCREDSREL